MANPSATKISSGVLIFPIITGRIVDNRFQREGFAGTGFFIGTNGLALTAAHVIRAANKEIVFSAALPTLEGPMLAHQLEWTTELPGSDIAVARFMVCNSPCFETQFRELDLGEDMHTTGVAECMLETEADGTTRILQRTAKGYVAYGKRTWVAVSFPLPAGMSGSPAVCTIDGFDHVVGVLVGQTRTEIIEDLIEEITEATPGRHTTRVERVSRVEYVSRVELLAQYKDYKAQEFGGITFGELIANEIPSRP